MIDPIASILERHDVVVLDGGLGTELEARGADLRDPLWSARTLIEAPDLIREVHEAFLDAGADVMTTSSYQASFEGLATRGFDRGAAEALLRRSVALAREARDSWWSSHEGADRPFPLVAASVGPYGALLGNGAEYTGEYDRGPAGLARFHEPRIETLAAAEPDLLAIETIPSIAEAEAIALVLAQVPEMPAWVSFSCRNAAEICDGTPIERAVAAVAGVPNVPAVGVNCTSPLHIEGLVRAAAATTGKPLVAYPNRGAFWDALRRTWVDPPRQDPRPSLRPDAWRDAGARLIGGCCGIGPSEIRSIAEALGRRVDAGAD